jgi:hypothetical protein
MRSSGDPLSDFTAVVPWRASTGERQRLWNFCKERWNEYGVPVIEADSGDEVFSRSKSKNLGVDLAETDVVVIADADTIPVLGFIKEAVRLAETEAWTLPYGLDRYYNLTERYTAEVLSRDPLYFYQEPVEGLWDFKLTSWAGMVTLRKELFVGYDERFVGWGWEDNAWAAMMYKEHGVPPTRVNGWVAHLWHTRGEDFGTDHELANRDIFNSSYRGLWEDAKRAEGAV